MGLVSGGFSNRFIFPLFFLALGWLAGCTQGFGAASLEEAALEEVALEEPAEPAPAVLEDRPGTPERPPYSAMMEPQENRPRIDFDSGMRRLPEDENEEIDLTVLKLDDFTIRRKD